MRLTDCLCDNDLNESLQSAYKKHHSCETALLRVQNDILKSINNKQCVVLLLLDLSAAFDTVDHKILLQRLRSRFGTRGNGLAWLQSYLRIVPSQFRLMDLLFSSSPKIWCTPGVRVGFVAISLIHGPTG